MRDRELALFAKISKDVHCFFTRYNKKKFNELMEAPQLKSLFRHYLSQPTFFEDSGLEELTEGNGKSAQTEAFYREALDELFS